VKNNIEKAVERMGGWCEHANNDNVLSLYYSKFLAGIMFFGVIVFYNVNNSFDLQ
jgi:hypothetical protein